MSDQSINKVAVIGAGVMGSGIAAHMANAGCEVILLDVVEGAAQGAIAKMLKTDPAPFMHKSFAKRITPGNLPDGLDLVKDADWIIEVIVENLDIKHDLYAQLDKVRKPGAVISSNTSTLPLAELVKGQSADFAKHFMITHFFNPPRYMRLLEMVAGPDTDLALYDKIEQFCDIRLGKGVVPCKDSPGFIANRIGIYWMQAAFNATLDMGVGVEEVDAVMARPMGIPKTGVFGLMDLIGLDLMPHVSKSMKDTLPAGDDFMTIHREPEFMTKMLEDGYTGRKGKGGFYRLNKQDGKRIKEVLNFTTMEYEAARRPKPAAALASKEGGMRGVFTHDSDEGRYAWSVMRDTLCYVLDVAEQTAANPHAIDEAMRLGYNWQKGPFQMIDEIGSDWLIDKLQGEGRDVPSLLQQAAGKRFYIEEGDTRQAMGFDGAYSPLEQKPGVLNLSDIKRTSKPVKKNGSASLWDIGDGVLCFEFTSKMNALDVDIMDLLEQTINLIGDGSGDYKALVVYNEGDNFSVGANLGLALFALNIGMWAEVEKMVDRGQDIYRKMKYAPFPAIVAPSGMALGGGCEITLHADAVQAHAETYIGLVEVGVGVIPGWGGCTILLERHAKDKKAPKGPMPKVVSAFETIGTAQVAKSAYEAKDLKFMQKNDGITMNRDRLLFDAKQKALDMAATYTPPEPVELILPGKSGKAALGLAVHDLHKSGKATDYDCVVADALSTVLTGGDADITTPLHEDEIRKLERDTFMTLIHNDGTLARIEHMLETGKPLRN